MRLALSSSLLRLAAVLGVCWVAAGAVGNEKEPAPISSLTEEQLRQQVTVRGAVGGFEASQRANVPNSFNLKDESGVIRVAVWPVVFDRIPFRNRVGDGAEVQATGRLAVFKGTWEIHVGDPEGLQVMDGAEETSAPAAGRAADGVGAAPGTVVAGVTPAGQAAASRLGDVYTVSGRVVSARRPSTPQAPYTLRLVDETGGIDVVFWEDLASELPESKRVEVGDRLQATGPSGEHRGRVQLQLESPESLKTEKSDPELFAAPRPGSGGGDTVATDGSAPAEAVAFDELTTSPPGRRVRLEGRVTSVEALRLGDRIRLRAADETTGPEAVILLWDTAHGLKPAVRHVTTSSTLAVAGVVADARGERVVVVRRPEDVLAVTP